MSKHALIIGGSSGMGLSTALKLARESYQVIIIHRDRRSVLEDFYATIAPFGAQIRTYNFDAVNPDKIQEHIVQFKSLLGGQLFHLVVHSVSRGNLKPLFAADGPSLSDDDMKLTFDAMALNLLTWVRALQTGGLLGQDSRVVALTSAGSDKVWQGYGAVGVAKAALEAITRYLAVELAPQGIRANIINAGITDTPSLRSIPGVDELIKKASGTNPSGRMTTPEDVANTIYLLTLPEAAWITGSLIHVDGGEHLIG